MAFAIRISLLLVAFLLLASTAHAAPKPEFGTVELLNTPGPQAELAYHVERRPQQPNLVVRCGDWFTEQLLGRGVMDAIRTVDLPQGATQCQAFALDEGSRNGKDATLISNVLFFTMQ